MLFVNRQYRFKAPLFLDVMIIRMFASIFILALILLYIQWNLRPICNAIGIYIINSQKTLHTGEVIAFDIKGARAEYVYTWEFGDRQGSSGKQVYHTYHKPGTFLVSVTAGKCRWNKEVMIWPALSPVIPKIAEEIFPVIEGPATTYVGRATRYSNNTPQAKSWLWSLIDQPEAKYTQSNITLVFDNPGEQVLSLIVNNDSNHLVTKRILVLPMRPTAPDIKPVKQVEILPAPVNSPPPKKSFIPITTEEFKYLLSQVANKTRKASDFQPYLCDPSINVIINGNESIDFNSFCHRIYGKRKLQIEQLNLNKDQNGCIREITIINNRKKVLGIF